MLGAIRSEQVCSAVTNFFAATEFENAIVVDDQNDVVLQIEHHEWRRLLAGGFDDSAPISLAIPAYETLAATTRTPARMALKSQFPRIKGEYQHNGGKLIRTSVQRPLDKGLSAYGLIMAGGFGRRLGELTKTIPKPMLDLAGRPICEHLLDNMIDNNISDIFFSVFHLKDRVTAHFGDGSKFNANVRYLEETRPLGTAGCLSLLPELDKPLLVVNGDVVTNVQFGRLIEFHTAANLDVTMSVKQHAIHVPYGVVDHLNGEVVRIREKPKILTMINVAIYVIAPRVLRHIPANTPIDMPTLLQAIIPRGYKVGTFPLVEDWIDVGTVPELERARTKLVANQGRRPLQDHSAELLPFQGLRDVG